MYIIFTKRYIIHHPEIDRYHPEVYNCITITSVNRKLHFISFHCSVFTSILLSMFDIFIRTPSLFPLHSSRPEPNRELKHIIYITVFKIQGLAQRELLLLTPFDFSTGSTGLGPGANTYNIQCTGARSTRATPLIQKLAQPALDQELMTLYFTFVVHPVFQRFHTIHY